MPIIKNSASEPVLSLEEITSVSTIAALQELYSQRGVDFAEDEQKFLDRIKADWRMIQRHERSRAQETPPSDEVPFIQIDSVRARIYGVRHTFTSGARYRDIVTETVGTGKGWVHEAYLEQYFPLIRSTQIPDYAANTTAATFAAGFKLGLYFPAGLFYSLRASARPKEASSNALKRFNIPLELYNWGPYPTFVDLELAERNGLAMSHPTKRSAYMAEFIRAWEPKDVEFKNALVGGMHAPEIKYFLEHPSSNIRLVDSAHQYAELLNRDPAKFASKTFADYNVDNLVVNAGGLAGASGYIFLTTAASVAASVWVLKYLS